MNPNTPNNRSYRENFVTAINTQNISDLIASLEVKYATNSTIIAMLGAIAKKVQEVPASVQNTVAELLRANLDSQIANMGLMTAAIMAINPQQTIADTKFWVYSGPANDPKFSRVA